MSNSLIKREWPPKKKNTFLKTYKFVRVFINKIRHPKNLKKKVKKKIHVKN